MTYCPDEPDEGLCEGFVCTNKECNKVIDSSEFPEYSPDL